MTNKDNANLIETNWYRLQDTGVEFYGEPPSFDDFQEAVLFWTRLNRLSTWVLADLARFGEKMYGETYAQIISATGLSSGRISNIVSVANKVPVEERRNLPFGHHATVAYMEPDERNYWLDRAEQEKLTREELREAIRANKIIPSDNHEVITPTEPVALIGTSDIEYGLSKLGIYDLVVEYVKAVRGGLDERASLVYQVMENLVRNSL